jgi:hypothetical protein
VYRRPLCGRFGPWLVAGLCSWELAALTPRSPVPTLTSVCRTRRAVAVLLLAALFHHWMIEETPCSLTNTG